jgi:hypothetical protein
MNAGCSETLVAKASKHRSNVIQGYVHPTAASTVAPVLSMVSHHQGLLQADNSLVSPEDANSNVLDDDVIVDTPPSPVVPPSQEFTICSKRKRG